MNELVLIPPTTQDKLLLHYLMEILYSDSGCINAVLQRSLLMLAFNVFFLESLSHLLLQYPCITFQGRKDLSLFALMRSWQEFSASPNLCVSSTGRTLRMNRFLESLTLIINSYLHDDTHVLITQILATLWAYIGQSSLSWVIVLWAPCLCNW